MSGHRQDTSKQLCRSGMEWDGGGMEWDGGEVVRDQRKTEDVSVCRSVLINYSQGT